MNKFWIEHIALLKIRLSEFGYAPMCNGKRSRGIFIEDFCFPLCTRCTFMIIFTLLFYILSLKKKIKKNPFLLNVICVIPLVIDGAVQYGLGFESTNIRRAITGALWGYGMGNFLGNIANYSAKNIE